ncbi:hypothetical protein ABRQ22_16720 [Cellulosimicrobium sp. ES-005]|uniref:Uncharacterized protein n=1 Tax=Cellulosimicrobium sp. ES-005 TaxID=3163031 RepID=A0AAU8FZC4_9MICO
MDLSPSSSALRTNPAGNLGVLVFGTAPIVEHYEDGSPVLPIPVGATPDDLALAQADGWNLLGIVAAGSPAGLVDMYVLSR